MTIPSKANVAAVGRVIARAGEDAAFRERVKADPAGVLNAEGAEVPPGATFEVVENTPSLIHLVLPPKPTGNVSAGSMNSNFGRVLAAAWEDAGARAALLADGGAVLRAHGVRIPDDTTVKFVEDTATALHLILPPLTVEGEISEADLESLTASGGGFLDDLAGGFEEIGGALAGAGETMIEGTMEGLAWGAMWWQTPLGDKPDAPPRSAYDVF